MDKATETQRLALPARSVTCPGLWNPGLVLGREGPGWPLAERPACPTSCAPQCVYRAAHPVGLLEFASVISQVEDQGHSSQGLTEVGPRPYLTGLISIPAGRGLISLPGVGVSSLDFLIPTSLLLFFPK